MKIYVSMPCKYAINHIFNHITHFGSYYKIVYLIVVILNKVNKRMQLSLISLFHPNKSCPKRPAELFFSLLLVKTVINNDAHTSIKL